MTLQEFLGELARTPRKWKLRDGMLRYRGRCPLEVVAGTRAMSLSKAKRRLRLLGATKIMRAADLHWTEGCPEQRLRDELLKACGI